MLRLVGTIASGSYRHQGRLRVPATVAFAGKSIKGWTFDRATLEASIPRWIGDPVSLGTHNPGPHLVADFTAAAHNPIVGEVVEARLMGRESEFQLVAEFDDGRLESALRKHGASTLEDLPGEVSLELVSLDQGATINHTNGFVILTETAGACSRADGCGLKFAESAPCCDDCADKEGRMGEDKPLTAEDVKKIVVEALKAQSASEDPPPDDPPKDPPKHGGAGDANAEKAKAYDELMAREQKAVIDALVKSGRYSDADRDDLAKVDVGELRVRLDLIEGGDKVAASSGTTLKSALFPPKGANTQGGEDKSGEGVKASGGRPKVLSWEQKVAKMREAG